MIMKELEVKVGMGGTRDEMMRQDGMRVKVKMLDSLLDISVQHPNPNRWTSCSGISALVRCCTANIRISCVRLKER